MTAFAEFAGEPFPADPYKTLGDDLFGGDLLGGTEKLHDTAAELSISLSPEDPGSTSAAETQADTLGLHEAYEYDLTIGLPVYDDFDGAVFTIQALRMYHDLTRVEIVVIDNAPHLAGGVELKGFVQNIGSPHIVYHEFTQATGPAGAKDRVFRVARGEFVLCIDSHILLEAGAVDKLKQYARSHRDGNIITGPLVYDNLINISTHFDPVWRGEMWGIWAESEQGKHPGNPPFEVWGNGCGLFGCRKNAWLGFNPNFIGFGAEEGYIHQKFRQAGHKALCVPFLRWWHRFGRPKGVPYPLNLWNKVRNYVLGHRELGLDVAPIHQHFVLEGGMPQHEWESLVEDPTRILPKHLMSQEQLAMHRAQQIAALQVPGSTGAAEGFESSEPAAGGQPRPVSSVPDEVIDALDEMVRVAVSATGQIMELDKVPLTAAGEAIYDEVRGIHRDLNQHMAKFRELAEDCDHVTEISERRESLIAFAAAKPLRLVAHNTEFRDPLAQKVLAELPNARVDDKRWQDIPSLDERTDLLFLDTRHTEAAILRELNLYTPFVDRYVVVHDTDIYGDKGEDGEPGLLWGLRKFLGSHPQWRCVYHTTDQHGLTVISKYPLDWPEKKIIIGAKNFGPGTQLKKMLSSLDINPSPSCDCNALANQMDSWGPEGCREHLEEILTRMSERAPAWGWYDRVHAAAKAVASGLAFKINPFDPFRSLLLEAIRLAELDVEPESGFIL